MKASALGNLLFALVASALLLLGTASEAAAQLTPQVRVGVKGGLDYSKIRLTFNDTDRTFGLTGGVFGRLQFGSGFSVQPELLYTQKGGVFSGAVGDGAGMSEVSFGFDYVETPVLLQLPLPLKTSVRPLLYVGPYAGWAVRKNVSIDAPEGVNPLEIGPEDFEDFDYGLVFGAEVDVAAGERTVNADFRWTLGTRDLDSSLFADEPGNEVGNTAHNGTLAVTVGVLF